MPASLRKDVKVDGTVVRLFKDEILERSLQQRLRIGCIGAVKEVEEGGLVGSHGVLGFVLGLTLYRESD